MEAGGNIDLENHLLYHKTSIISHTFQKIRDVGNSSSYLESYSMVNT